MSAGRAQDPLAPMAFAAKVLAWVIGLSIVVGTGATLEGQDSIFGFGGDDACIVSAGDFRLPPSLTREGLVHPAGSRAVTVSPDTFRVCAQHPSFSERVSAGLPEALWLLFVFVFALLTIKALRCARRNGLFTYAVARQVSVLGVYLLAGAVTVMVASSIANETFLRDALGLAHRPSTGWDVPWSVLVAGCGVITVGRVMRIGVRMQDDIDATI